MIKIIFSFLLCTLVPVSIFSQEMVTDRPDQTESSSTVPRLSLQWESGFSWQYHKVQAPLDQEVKMNDISINSSLLRFGILERFELRLGWDYLYTIRKVYSGNELTSKNSAGEFESFYLGAKIKLADENGFVPELALLGHTTLYAESELLAEESFQPDLTVAGSWTLSPASGLGVNLGLQWAGFNDGGPDIFYSMVVGFSHGEKLSSFWEIYGFRYKNNPDIIPYESSDKRDDFQADFGFTYLLRENFQLDLSVGAGFSEISPDFFISTGFSWRIPR